MAEVPLSKAPNLNAPRVPGLAGSPLLWVSVSH